MYKRWISNRDKEINCLKEKGKKTQNEMKRMERLHEKQQAVLKRKFEEAKAINKRLQDAVDKSRRNRKTNTGKVNEKTDVVQTYIDHELLLLVSTVDVKNVMQSLMNDRGMLLERLQNLKSTVNKNDNIEEEICQLEEDLEMRNAQITDMRSKVAETDIDAKMKSIPENYSTVPELRIAMGYILRAFVETREDFIKNKSKSEDLRAAFDASEERIEQIMLDKAEMIEKYESEKDQMERDFEQKITFLCQKHNGNISKAQEDKCFSSLTEQLSAKIEECSEQKKRIDELERLLNEKDNTQRKKVNLNRTPNGTFIIDDSDESPGDDDEEFGFNDSFNDPDWVKTPLMKKQRTSRPTTTLLKESIVNRMDGTNILINISETSDTSGTGTKRNSSGQAKCSCKGSCATKLCGCKKSSHFCSENCKCSDACVNKASVSKESQEEEERETAEVVTQSKENSRTPERLHSK